MRCSERIDSARIHRTVRQINRDDDSRLSGPNELKHRFAMGVAGG